MAQISQQIAEKYYNLECSRPSDIFEHLPTLKKYAEECSHITEMGMRDIVSTWAFLVAKPKKLISYDINYPSSMSRLNELMSAAKEINVDFKFIKEDVLKVQMEQTDLLFIDTLHRGTQLKQELAIHSGKVNKYIILHDTVTFSSLGESDRDRPEIKYDGLKWALDEFLENNKEWIIKEVYKNCNGLTILKRNELYKNKPNSH